MPVLEHFKLEGKLNDEQKKLLVQLLDAMENKHNCDAKNRFIRGYSLGVLIATEVMEEWDKFLIEESCILYLIECKTGHFQIWECPVCVFGNKENLMME